MLLRFNSEAAREFVLQVKHMFILSLVETFQSKKLRWKVYCY